MLNAKKNYYDIIHSTIAPLDFKFTQKPEFIYFSIPSFSITYQNIKTELKNVSSLQYFFFFALCNDVIR